MKVFPIAGSFGLAQIFAMKALRFYDPGSLKVIAQVNVPLTALLSWLLLERRYSLKQWLAIALLGVVAMAFLQVRMLFFQPSGSAPQNATPEDGRMSAKVMGMLYFQFGIVLSCLASIFAEKFLKDRCEMPFYIQKTNLMFGELLCAALTFYANTASTSEDGGDGTCSWEQIHTPSCWQLAVIFLWLLHGWVAGLLVKRSSALVKNVSHILSTAITYTFPLLFLPGTLQHSLPVTLSALLVLTAVMLFAAAPPESKQPSKPLRRATLSERPMLRSTSESGLKNIKRQKEAEQVQDKTAHMEEGKRGTGSEQPVAYRPGSKEIIATERPIPKTLNPPSRGLSPEALRTGQTVNGLWLVVSCFIILDALKPILVTWANTAHAVGEPSFIQGTFVLVQTALSLLVGLGIAMGPHISSDLRVRLRDDWRPRVLRCLDPKAVTRQLPVSLCLCLSKLFLVYSLGRLDAGTVRVFGQASLPLVGVSTALFFKRRYSLQQWCSLVAVSLGLVTFYFVKAEAQQQVVIVEESWSPRRIEFVGIMLVLGSICFNCLGALLVENFLKAKGELYEQKAQLLLGEVVVNSILVFVGPLFITDLEVRAMNSPWQRGFFSGWDGRVLVCAILWIPAGWTATMLVKRCSNLLKTLAQAFSSVLTYVFSVVPLSSGPRTWAHFVTMLGPPLTPEPVSSPVVLLAISVMISALTFGADRREPKISNRRHTDHQEVPEKWKVDSSYLQVRPRSRQISESSGR